LIYPCAAPYKDKLANQETIEMDLTKENKAKLSNTDSVRVFKNEVLDDEK
jgi:hypothetical protein